MHDQERRYPVKLGFTDTAGGDVVGTVPVADVVVETSEGRNPTIVPPQGDPSEVLLTTKLTTYASSE
jgi:hypothetical protein